MNKNLLCLLAVIIILVALHLSVAYKPVRSLKYYRRKPWIGYRRPQWQRFSHPPKRPLNKRRPEFNYPPQRRPPRSHHFDNNREQPFTIEFELPIEYINKNYQNHNDDDDDIDYTLDDYIDEDYVNDPQIRVKVVKEGEKRLRIKLSRNDNFESFNKLLTNGSNY